MENNLFEGLIVKSTGGLYTVETDTGEKQECRAKGSFRHSKITPLTGDRVVFEKAKDNEGFITQIKPRKNSLIRPAVANVDLLCIVVAASKPEPDLFILDKLTAVAKKNNIEVLLIVNKTDIGDFESIREVYENAGFNVLPMCAVNSEDFGKSIGEIRERIKGKITFFTGASGVGKSSVLNAVFPDLALETGNISEKIGRGKHTTRITTLFKIQDGTYVGDTPGFSMLDVAGFNMLDSETLLSSFCDIEKYATGCKFKKCTHVCEEGCSVMEALKEGKIQESRHESYKTLFKELAEIKPWDNKN